MSIWLAGGALGSALGYGLAQIDPGPWTQFGPIGAVVLGLLAVVWLFLKFLGKHIDANTIAQREAAQAQQGVAYELAQFSRRLEKLIDRMERP